MILINQQQQQQLQLIFGLVFLLTITVHGHLIALLLPLHLARVLPAPMLTYSAQSTQQKTPLSIHIPFSIALKDLGLVPLEMVPVVIALLRIAHCITFLQGEALQKQLHHRMLRVKRPACVPFIRRLGNRKVQKEESF